jgi:MoxR-like ATPase
VAQTSPACGAESPDAPDLAETPGGPEAWDTSEASGSMKTSEASATEVNASESQEARGAAGAAAAPDASALSGGSAVPDARAVPGMAGVPGSPGALAELLDRHRYLADEGLATACFLALRMRRPLFLEGEAGVGKTALAHALSEALDVPLIRLQCYEGLDAAQALYDWDFPRQLLHLRAAEAAGSADVDRLEAELYDRRFLLARPLLRAVETAPSVLLVDEVDRADDEFEAFLLEMLSDFTISIPELGTIRAAEPPIVVVTSNRTREVHDALKRRCLYHWLENPSFGREVAIIRRRLPEATDRLARQVAAAAARLRTADLLKAPGIAESIDWASALVALGARDLDPDTAAVTLGAALKYREDTEQVRARGLATLLSADGPSSADGSPPGGGSPSGGDSSSGGGSSSDGSASGDGWPSGPSGGGE